VDQWREANPWAVQYGKLLWDAMHKAVLIPGSEQPAGRVVFMYHSLYLGGTLSCTLPSGRRLIYRALKREWIDILDNDDNVVDRKLEWTYARAYGRQKLWPGIFVENVTQATAADFLRGTLVRLEEHGFATRLHTHDECLVECDKSDACTVAYKLQGIMRRGFPWSAGLPIMSEETVAYYYSKDERSHGL